MDKSKGSKNSMDIDSMASPEFILRHAIPHRFSPYTWPSKNGGLSFSAIFNSAGGNKSNRNAKCDQCQQEKAPPTPQHSRANSGMAMSADSGKSSSFQSHGLWKYHPNNYNQQYQQQLQHQQQVWLKCKECGFVCHEQCASACKPTCGLSPLMINQVMQMMEKHNRLMVNNNGHLKVQTADSLRSAQSDSNMSIDNDDIQMVIEGDITSMNQSTSGSMKSSSRHSPSNNSGTNNNSNNKSRSKNLIKKHQYVRHSFVTPNQCQQCGEQIWGDTKRGLKCFDCGSCLHTHCFDKIAYVSSDSPSFNTIWYCDPNEMMKEVLSPSSEKFNSLGFEEAQRDFADSSMNLDGTYGSTRNDHGVNNDTMNGTKQRRAFGTIGDTLMRLQRNQYKPIDPPPPLTEIFNKNIVKMANPEPEAVKYPDIIAGTLEGSTHRKIHPFRGHDYRATYLQPMTDERNQLLTRFSCQYCHKELGDDGRQCYQCKLCSYYCHKKCYTLTKPCPVSIGTLDDRLSPAELEFERKQTQKQIGVIQMRNSVISSTMDRQQLVKFVEDFSDELIRSTAAQAAALERMDSEDAIVLMSDYNIEDKIIGSGQYGVVKKGWYKHNQKQAVAIKIIDKRKLWDPLKKNSAQNGQVGSVPTILKRELDILQKLDHVGIVRMHNFFDTARHTYIVMDLANNGDLLDFIMSNQRLDEKLVHEVIAMQVIKALKYLHDRDVVHRDLKPENLLLCKNEDDGTLTVKIADFGFATIYDKVAGTNSMQSAALLQSVVGTPAYMAPEIVDPRVWHYCVDKNARDVNVQKPKKGYDKSADMWSLGVIFYVCLGGVFPFDTQQPILDQIMRGEFFFPDEYFDQVSDEAVDFVCNLLVVNPRRRMTCAESLRHVWLSD
ncbi:hypothetical protein MIR68_008306 [Amoeboaphelidium protococcarum]|nr:hypothetical protein MIR68_008306 [Amoeboaphelidium protococcarum]